MKLANLFSTALLLQGSRGHEAKWRQVYLAETKLTGTFYQEEIRVIRNFECLMRCLHLAWCLVTCEKELGRVCILSNAIVAGNYIEDKTGVNLLPCYTKNVSPNLVVGKSIVADSYDVNFPARKPANLVDGYYSYDLQQCWYSEQNGHHWATVDLESPTYISKIVFLCQHQGYVYRYCEQITFKVGLTPDPNNMTTFGRFEGLGIVNQSVCFTTKTAQLARYIYFEKANDNDNIQMCHLDVQGN